MARVYADWCFERTARLPSEWTVVDTATTGSRARDFLRKRFESSYPFHPSTLSVFQRKWRALTPVPADQGGLGDAGAMDRLGRAGANSNMRGQSHSSLSDRPRWTFPSFAPWYWASWGSPG